LKHNEKRPDHTFFIKEHTINSGQCWKNNEKQNTFMRDFTIDESMLEEPRKQLCCHGKRNYVSAVVLTSVN